MISIGIDVGESGAIAFIGANGLTAGHKFTNWRSMAKLLKEHALTPGVTVGIERFHPRPPMGRPAICNMGQNIGGWICLFECLKISYITIPPQTWQKAVIGSFPKGESKPAALKYATRKWPHLGFTKDDHGIIDALCIAQYMRQTNK